MIKKLVFLTGIAMLAICSYGDVLSELVAEDLTHEVRPGGGDRPFWNTYAQAFMYPPSFDFQTSPKAASYRFTVVCDKGENRIFFADAPTDSLRPVWSKIPTGMTTVICDGVDSNTNTTGIVGTRTFWKRAPFKPGTYQAAARPYVETAEKFYDFIFEAPFVRHLLETGETDPAYFNNCYPTKMNAAIIRAMVRYAKRRPERAEEAIRIARAAADYLINASEKPDAPLAGFPPTYETRPELVRQAAKWLAGRTMMNYPATGIEAYLDLYESTKDDKYLTASKAIGETYLRLQGDDGTWGLMLYLKDGSDYGTNRLYPVTVARILERLGKVTNDKRYGEAAARAFAYAERGPLKDFNWDGQFEDAGVNPVPYKNLTKHMPCDCAIYLLERYPDDTNKVAIARELVRFAEDQFVYWEKPCRADGGCMPTYPRKWNESLHFDNWTTYPCVGEQYSWNVPIDASAAKLIRSWLALWRVTRNPLDYAKARAMGNALTYAQLENGDMLTHWTQNLKERQLAGTGGGWINCGVAAAVALEELAETEELPVTVKAGAIMNMRDIGGWPAFDGRKVKKGQLYRSAGLNSNATSEDVVDEKGLTNKVMKAGVTRVTDKNRALLVDKLGIKTDIDFRTDNECWGMTGSPLGDNVEWAHIPTVAYMLLTVKDGDNSKSNSHYRIFKTIMDPTKRPLVFHCIAGRDRTGTIAMLTLALLGVSENDIICDYMATPWFSERGKWEARMRKVIHEQLMKRFPADTLAESAALYFEHIGFTRAEIDAFRADMLIER